MITLVISDTEGKELESNKIAVGDVLPYIKLIETYGYLSDDGDEYKFKRAQVLSEGHVYVDVEIQ